jgi:hypothetical protein|tara:strand:+ start:385 stop:564 length:180 start_codon:yes stop_codon:yes gene_type:complete
MSRKLSQAVIDRLMKKYKKRLGAKVGDSKQFAKAIAGGTKIPTYAKKGGHVRKKTKKKK